MLVVRLAAGRFYRRCVRGQVFSPGKPQNAAQKHDSGQSDEGDCPVRVPCDVAKRGEGKDVAEGMDNQDVKGKSGGPDLRHRNISQGRVGRACIEKEKEDGSEHQNPSRWKWREEHQNKKRHREQHANTRNHEIGARYFLRRRSPSQPPTNVESSPATTMTIPKIGVAVGGWPRYLK